MIERIESTSNPKVKHLVRLRKSSRYRKEMGLFIVEGKREIEAMLSSGKFIEELYFSNELLDGISIAQFLPNLNEKITTFDLSHLAMNKISYRDQAKDAVGLVKVWDLALPNSHNLGLELVLVLDEVEKPGNLGAILRTADAMGVDAVVLSDSCVDFFNPNVVRSSMGLFASMPVFSGTKESVFHWLNESKLKVLGTSSKGTEFIHNFTFDKPAAIVMGSESHGLGSFWAKNISGMISIPLYGRASSLNLNCATACVLMEFNRQTKCTD